MRYSFLYTSCMCLLTVLFTLSVKAQQKVPDMSRYSKAPISPDGNGGNGSARRAAKSAGIQTQRTSFESFTKASVKPGGAGKASPARTVARTVVMPANVALTSSAQAAQKPAAQKKAISVVPDAIQEQLNMKQPAAEVTPAKPAAAKKVPARS